MIRESAKPQAIFFTQIAMLLTAFLIGFGPTLLALHNRWWPWTASYSYGYLVLATAIYLYFDSNQAAPRWLPDIRNIALALLALSSIGWLVFYLAGIGVLQQILLPVIVLAALGSLLEANFFWRGLIPICLIYLAIPIWDDLLSTTLQRLSTIVPGWAVAHLFGIPASISGSDITIPAGIIKVETGCSGLIFFLSALILGIVYGQFFLFGVMNRVAAAIIAAVLGILVNWIRITSLIVIGQTSNMKNSLLTEGHVLFGWYLFSGIAIAVIFLASKLQTRRPPIRDTSPVKIMTISAKRFASTLLALAVGPLLLLALHNHALAHSHTVTQPPQYLGSLLERTETRLTGFIKPTINVTYLYVLQPDLTVSVVSYPSFFGDGKLVDQVNRIWPANAEILEQAHVNTKGLPPVLATRFRLDNQIKLAWGWYVIGDTHADSLGQAKLAQLTQTLKGHFGGEYIHVEIICRQVDCAQEALTLAQNAPEIYTEINVFIAGLVKN